MGTVKKHGKPTSILTYHDSQFYATESDIKEEMGIYSKFEQRLVDLGIKHVLARVKHPCRQTARWSTYTGNCNVSCRIETLSVDKARCDTSGSNDHVCGLLNLVPKKDSDQVQQDLQLLPAHMCPDWETKRLVRARYF